MILHFAVVYFLFPARTSLVRDQNVSRFSRTLHPADFGSVVVSPCQINSFSSGAGVRSEGLLNAACFTEREALLTPCFWYKRVQTDSGTDPTTNGRFGYSFILKTVLLSLKTASSFVSKISTGSHLGGSFVDFSSNCFYF